ncbi:MAG: hypothetical protein ACR2QF_14430 [Geminicoccaceae bacterium]
MKTIEQLKDWAIEDGDVQSPQTITIVPTVRTGADYPLPPWFTPRKSAEPSKS